MSNDHILTDLYLTKEANKDIRKEMDVIKAGENKLVLKIKLLQDEK
jgi:hypothetical protein